MDEIPKDVQLEKIVSMQVAECNHFAATLSSYNIECRKQGVRGDYKLLASLIQGHIDDRRRAKNRKEADKPTIAAPASVQTPKPPKGACRDWYWSKYCPRGDACPYDHFETIASGKGKSTNKLSAST